jgi:tetratricopeptide (TPR) repeat protein
MKDVGGVHMYYCPNCGSKVEKNEHFCMVCGKTLPDITSRIQPDKIKKWWILPISILLFLLLFTGFFQVFLNHQNEKALDLYIEGEDFLMDENYSEASELFNQALEYRSDFDQAEIALDYSEEAIEIEKNLNDIEEEGNIELTDTLAHIQEMETELNKYQGEAVSILIEKLDQAQSNLKLRILQDTIDKGPSMNEIRMLIYEAEEINHPEAGRIANELRTQLVDYTSSKASEALNEKQFNDALLITEDGLKYAPDSEKLHSLLTNITKEKHAFESALQNRIEQAVDMANQEYQTNEFDAIELTAIEVTNNSDGQIVIEGEVLSRATVPIHSILIEYILLEEQEEIARNEIFVYPDTLYPNEHGKFDFTHFDINKNIDNIDAEVNKITWYTS